MRLSDRIRAARLRNGWKQTQLAAMLKVDRSAVGHIGNAAKAARRHRHGCSRLPGLPGFASSGWLPALAPWSTAAKALTRSR